jgi:hypothetical protein
MVTLLSGLGNVFVFFTFYHSFCLFFKIFLAPTSIHQLNVVGSVYQQGESMMWWTNFGKCKVHT